MFRFLYTWYRIYAPQHIRILQEFCQLQCGPLSPSINRPFHIAHDYNNKIISGRALTGGRGGREGQDGEVDVLGIVGHVALASGGRVPEKGLGGGGPQN
jgi:hypothetical protein